MIDALHKIYKICIVLNFSMYFKCIVLEQSLHLESFFDQQWEYSLHIPTIDECERKSTLINFKGLHITGMILFPF